MADGPENGRDADDPPKRRVTSFGHTTAESLLPQPPDGFSVGMARLRITPVDAAPGFAEVLTWTCAAVVSCAARSATSCATRSSSESPPVETRHFEPPRWRSTQAPQPRPANAGYGGEASLGRSDLPSSP